MSQDAQQSTAASATKRKSRRKAIDTWKSKLWYELVAPKTFKEMYLGSIPSGDPRTVNGRLIEVLLYDITNNFRHTNTKLTFKVTEMTGEKCLTRLQGMELTRDYIRSQIHRGSSRVDGIFNYTTADGFMYRVSTFVITRRRAKRSQKKTIRKIIYQVLSEFAKNMPHDRFVRGIIFGKFASNVSRIAKTIYPLKECQIRKIKVVKMPEGVPDQFFAEDDESVQEIALKMREHGKTIKAKKAKHKKEGEGAEGETSEGEATPTETAAGEPGAATEPKTEEKKE